MATPQSQSIYLNIFFMNLTKIYNLVLSMAQIYPNYSYQNLASPVIPLTDIYNPHAIHEIVALSALKTP